MSNEEHLAMLENLLESDELELDTALVRRARRKGQIEAEIETRRDDTLQVIVERFDPADDVYDEVESKLMQVDNLEQLHELFTAALRTPELQSFLILLS
jgi:thymidylate kinase